MEYFNSEKPLNRNISVETPTSRNYQGVKCPGAIVRGLKYNNFSTAFFSEAETRVLT